MKQWKGSLISAIEAETKESKIVSLREVADAQGIRHIPAQDAREIMAAVLKAVPNYRAVQMMRTPNDSLAQSLCFVQEGVEFESEDEFLVSNEGE